MADDRVSAVAEAMNADRVAHIKSGDWRAPSIESMAATAVDALDAYDRRTEADLRERLAQAVEAERDFWLACDPDSPKPPQRGSVRWAVARAYDVAADTIRERP